MQQLHFTPITPQYQIQEFPFPYVQMPSQQQYEPRGFPWQQSIHDYTTEMPSQIFSPLSPQGNQRVAENLEFNTQMGDFVAATLFGRTGGHRSPSMNILDVEWLKTNTPPVQISGYKRHSTGGRGAPKIWSDKKEAEVECKEENLEGSQYSGYYLDEK
jgi:hypothetical protein